MSSLPGSLVSTQWLADHLGADGLLVVDASVVSYTQPNGRTGMFSGHELYIADGHLPGAVFADLLEEFSAPDARFPFTRPDAARFAAAAGALGIGRDTDVVVYDGQHGQFAARLWWLLGAFGHDRVAVLDGGLTVWRAEGRETVVGHVEPAPATFVPRERPERWAHKAEVEAIVRGERAGALVCASPAKEFRGEVAPRGRAGHIPGSISAPATRFVDPESRATLPDDEVRPLLAPALDAERIVAYCGAGVAASAAALHLLRAGAADVAVYDGSLNEWTADPDAPLATLVPTP